MNHEGSTQVAQAEYDAALEVLAANKQRWVQVSLDERIRLLGRIKDALMPVAQGWAESAARHKGVDPATPLAGEEWMSGPLALMTYCNALADTLRNVVGRKHLKGVPMRTLPSGQLAVKVFPQSTWDRLLLSGVSAEVWMEPGVTAANLPQSTASIYNTKKPHAGKVALVLGAGNIAAIAPLDCLHKLFVDNEVVLLKMNPVNEYLTDFLAPALAPLIEAGFLRIVRGDAQAGAYLCTHPKIETLHITGSGVAHDAIVWGPGEEGVRNKKAGTPRNIRPISSELGGVGPTIVVPGPWSAADVRFQAEHVASQKLHNAGFNCIACQVLVVSSDWAQKESFLSQVRQTLAASTPRPVYYPGAGARLGQFQSAAGATASTLASTNQCLMASFDSSTPHRLEGTEVFGPAMAVTQLKAANAEAFLIAAIAYANERLDGTLGANILIHPKTLREIGRKRFDEILAELRYGCIAVNAWTGLGFLLAQVPWGAYPGHTREHIGSGQGHVHNTLLFERTQRTVIEAPFAPYPRNLLSGGLSLLPRPPWFVTNKRSHVIGRLLTAFQYRPSWAKLPAIFANALRG
jgi:acyl-CoA reductase-like NAD-dependent aldehyde dehydrogenase